jgi:hypothetical protein
MKALTSREENGVSQVPADVLNRMTMDFLVTAGYKEAAQTFAEEAGVDRRCFFVCQEQWERNVFFFFFAFLFFFRPSSNSRLCVPFWAPDNESRQLKTLNK